MTTTLIYSSRTRRLNNGQAVSITKLAENDYSVLKNLSIAFPLGLDKETLTARAWPGRVVTDSSLKVSIHKLRKILNYELRLKIKIIYIRGRGYLLSEPIKLEENKAEKSQELDIINKLSYEASPKISLFVLDKIVNVIAVLILFYFIL